MSEEEKEKRRNGAVGGGFEGGIRSALEKAPGMAVPSWAAMQSAMAGGAAGGTAAVTWRWLIGPAAGAALVGGAFWLTESAVPQEEDPSLDPGVESHVPFVDSDDRVESADYIENDSSQTDEGSDDAAGDEQVSNLPEDMGRAIQAQVDQLEVRGDASKVNQDRKYTERIEVPENWAELPVEEAAAFAVEMSEACVGTEISFGMGSAMKDVRVLWNFGDGQFSSNAEPSHIFRAPGTYDITLSVTRVSDGVIRTRTIENLVTIHPIPEADFTWEVPSRASKLPRVSLRDRSRDATSSTWIVDGESSRAGESTSFELSRVGEHVIQLVASSAHGCQSVAHRSVQIGNRFGLGGAARFSPNGDGRYDSFLPQKLLREESSFVFRVEDAEGRIVYETTRAKPWDGTLPDGNFTLSGQEFNWTVVVQGQKGPSYFSDVILIE